MTSIEASATHREIAAQPGIWRRFAAPLWARAGEIAAFIERTAIREVWFCGAGTSAFIGETLAAAPQGGPLRLKSVATTDLVAAPGEHLTDDPALLLVQFGRSGDSSESVGALALRDAHMSRAHLLHVTCNPAGALAVRPVAGPGEREVLLLPEETHDAGFAMTSSYTTMLLGALACIDRTADAAERLPRLADAAECLLARLASAPARPERAIFLGSGALKGVARESALKVLELTAGRTMTQWDSALGFRHGPKAAVGAGTLVVVFVHPDPHTAAYDRDMAAEIARQFPDVTLLTVGPGDCDIAFEGTGDARWDAVLYVLLAQVWALAWSHGLGLNVDDPFAAEGNLSRVVSGVTLYPYAA